MCWRRHVGMDREGDDVALVDHQPHPAVGRDLVADAGHEVLGEPVRLEVVAVGLGRPRRVEAGALDGVDGRQVVDPHRLDAQRSSGVARPRHLPALRARPRAAGSRIRARARRGRRRRPRPQAVPRRARRARRPARPVPPLPRSTRVGSAPGRRGRWRRAVSAGQVGLRRRPDQARPARPAGRAAGRTVRPAAAGPACRRPAVAAGEQGLRRRDADDRARPRPWARPLAVASPTRRPVNAPGPVPTTMADQPRAVGCSASPSKPAIAGRSVSPWR